MRKVWKLKLAFRKTLCCVRKRWRSKNKHGKNLRKKAPLILKSIPNAADTKLTLQFALKYFLYLLFSYLMIDSSLQLRKNHLKSVSMKYVHYHYIFFLKI